MSFPVVSCHVNFIIRCMSCQSMSVHVCDVMSFLLFVWDTLLVELSVGVLSLDDEVVRASIVLQGHL